MISGLNIETLFLLAVPILLAMTVHEYAHGYVAKLLGDPTAESLGRLTFNPFAHLDLIGTIVLFVTGFIGWAKPVPVNAGYFKNPVRDMALVAIAGPLANILLAFVFFISLKILFLFNLNSLIPIAILKQIISMFLMGIILNFGFAFFNMLPIPPLDGFRVLSYFLSAETVNLLLKNRYPILIGFFILIYFGAFKPVYAVIKSFVVFLLNL